jgi:hypothetical protein
MLLISMQRSNGSMVGLNQVTSARVLSSNVAMGILMKWRSGWQCDHECATHDAWTTLRPCLAHGRTVHTALCLLGAMMRFMHRRAWAW